MRQIGDVAAGGHPGVQQLEREPDADQHHRSQPDEKENKERHERQHPGVRVEHHVGAEDAGDRAARADQRHRRARVLRGVGETRHDAANQVEGEELEMPELVLDVVAEHPEIEHVADQVHPAAVQEERRHQGDFRRYQVDLGRQDPVAQQQRRNRAEGVDPAGLGRLAQAELPQEDQHAGGDQRHRDDRRARRRVLVAQWDHRMLPPSATALRAACRRRSGRACAGRPSGWRTRRAAAGYRAGR